MNSEPAYCSHNTNSSMKLRLIPVGLALTVATVARADFNPIAITPGSYNQDIVVEKGGPAALVPGGYTTASMDGGVGNNNDTWSEQGYFREDTAVGLPPAGTTFTSTSDANHQFQMAPSYTANNAIMLDATVFTNLYTWTVTTPRACSGLSFLTSGGNGGCQFRWTAHHQDGTTETGTAASPDWFFVNNPPRAWTANVRANAQTFTRDNYQSDNPRLYEVDVVLTNSTSPVSSIDIQFVSSASGAHSVIMAISGGLSGSFTPLAGSGYNADVVVEASAPELADVSGGGSVTATMDNDSAISGDTWYEQGLAPLVPNTGIPAAGSTFAASNAPDHHFTMPASYVGNNAIWINSIGSNATITLVTPTAATGLSFLGASANGTQTIQVVIHHQDGSTETNSLVMPDWFGGTARAWTPNGRFNIGNSLIDNLNSDNPRLYYSDLLVANTTSPITSLDLTFLGTGGRSAIFALSSTTGAIKPTFVINPASSGVSPGAKVTLSALVSGTAPNTYQWQKGTNGVFVNVGTSAVDQTNLVLNSVGAADWADYRAIASNAAGSATSAVATVTVLSSLPVVTVPTDAITAYGPGANEPNEGVRFAIDGTTSKYLSFGNGAVVAIPVGFVVTPSMGPTKVTVMRFFTAGDAPERDWANYVIEGSNDGGVTYSLIASNALTLPDARNAGGAALDPTTQALTQVWFVNNVANTSYRVYTTKTKGNVNLMQIGEVQLLGVADTSGRAFFTQQPASVKAYDGTSAQLMAAATGTPTPALRWYRGTNGVYVPLADGGNISGSQTATLTVNPAGFADMANYVAVASNNSGSVTSAVATVTILTSLNNVLAYTDPITDFGQSAGTSNFWAATAAPINAIDTLTTKYQNGGHGFSAEAGFPPFVGPVGLVVTPVAGATLVSALRIFTADGNPERDPADYTLEGSNDAGAHWTVISSGALALPLERNAGNQMIDPLSQNLQEIRFNNSWAFTSYRLTFNHTRNDSTASSLQIAEFQLPGVVVGSGSSSLTFARTGNNLVITSPVAGTLQSNTSLTNPAGWVNVQPVTAGTPVTLSISSSGNLFYRVKIQ